MDAARGKTIRWVATGVLLTALLVVFGVEARVLWDKYREWSYWRQVRAEMVPAGVRPVQWHPTRPEVLAEFAYLDVHSPTTVEGRIAVVSAGGGTRFLTRGHYDFRPSWSPKGTRVAFLRYGHSYSRRDMELFRLQHPTPQELEEHQLALSKRADVDLFILDSAGRVRRLGDQSSTTMYLYCRWLDGNRIAAMVLPDYPSSKETVLQVWGFEPHRLLQSFPLPRGFHSHAVETSPGDDRVAFIDGGSKERRGTIGLRDVQTGGWQEVPFKKGTGGVGLRWLPPPADVLVTRSKASYHAGDPMVLYRVSMENLSLETITMPALPGYKYQFWSMSGDEAAVAATAVRQKADRSKEYSLRLWRKGWKKPMALRRSSEMFVDPLFSPDGKWLAYADGTQVQFIDLSEHMGPPAP